MKFSRTVVYAIQATLQLAEEQSELPVPCSRLAHEGHMPERFLLQILRNLVTHGILQSTRGVDGGYSLFRSPQEISLLDVIEAIDGPLSALVPASDLPLQTGMNGDHRGITSKASNSSIITSFSSGGISSGGVSEMEVSASGKSDGESVDGESASQLVAAHHTRLREAFDGVVVSIRRQLHAIKMSDLVAPLA